MALLISVVNGEDETSAYCVYVVGATTTVAGGAAAVFGFPYLLGAIRFTSAGNLITEINPSTSSSNQLPLSLPLSVPSSSPSPPRCTPMNRVEGGFFKSSSRLCDYGITRVEVSPLQIAKRCKICGEFEYKCKICVQCDECGEKKLLSGEKCFITA